MRIPFFYNPFNKEKRFLYIERAFRTKKEIIPIGCDCHPAYVLQRLHIRQQSFPFDWLNNSSIESIAYVSSNIENEFSDFISKLKKNNNNHVIAEKYPYCEFLHEPNLIENKDAQKKFIRRYKRFLSTIENKGIYFINNVSALSFLSENDISYFIRSVDRFSKKHLKETDSLHIYIRYDESLNENKKLTGILFEKLNEIDKVFCVRYVRYNKQYPTWGNPKHYPKLLKSLNINVKEILPKVYIKNY